MTNPTPKVAFIMGSDSDLPIFKKAHGILTAFGVDFDIEVLSAHRTPELLAAYLEREEAHIDLILAAAGKAAHLPGVVASHSVKPVIGIPVYAKDLGGNDALLSIAQMPPGIPVATVGIDAGENAALLAVEILGLKYPHLVEAMKAYRSTMKEKVRTKNAAVKEEVATWTK